MEHTRKGSGAHTERQWNTRGKAALKDATERHLWVGVEVSD